jgi:hypothetical protein
MNDSRDEELIRRLERLGEVRPAPDTTRKALDRVRRALVDTARPVANPFPTNRRYLMRTLVSSAAAAVILVAGLVLFFLSSAPSVALADVVEAAKKYKLVKYKHEQTDVVNDVAVGPLEKAYYADLKALRLRWEHTNKFQDPDDGEKFIEEILVGIQDTPNGRVLMTQTHSGGVVLAARKDATLFRIPDEGKKGQSFLENLEEFQQKKGVTSGKDTLAGREMIRFRLEDNKTTALLWVDAKTKLPFRIETEIVTPNATHKFAQSDFEWDPPLPKGFMNLDTLFSTQAPDGHILDDQTKNGK